MNDSREFNYCRELFRMTAAEVLQEQECDTEQAELWKARLEVLSHDMRMDRMHPFVLSLSAQGDLLSQWRGYGATTGGFSIGVRRKVLRDVLPQAFTLQQCVYDQDEQRQLIRKAVLDTKPTAEQMQKLSKPMRWNAATVRLYMYFAHTYSTVFKHPSFQQEEEWRCVSPWNGGKYGWPKDDPHPPILEVRPGHSMLIPYVRISIDEHAMQSLVARVCIGPTPNVELAIRSATAFLKEHGLTPEVLPSTVPFRAW